jgi:hypothetical protein
VEAGEEEGEGEERVDREGREGREGRAGRDGREVVRAILEELAGPREDTVSTTPRRGGSPVLGSGSRNLRCCSGSNQYSGGWPWQR